MIAVKPTDLRNQQKKYFEQAYAGETVIVSRPQNQNVVIIGENEYNNMLKAMRNAAYLSRLDKSYEQLEQGQVVIKSMTELDALANG